jgi:hypothetical protein
MDPRDQAARRREKRILLFILILSCVTVLRLWDMFGVISLPGPFGDAFWWK